MKTDSVKDITIRECTGCGACSQVCPKDCIRISESPQGFLHPSIQEKDCIHCGRCSRVCPSLAPGEARKPKDIWAAYALDGNIRSQSSSGGLFTLLARETLRRGGVVFGAGYDASWQVIIQHTDHEEGLVPMRGSKYIQAHTGQSFQDCRDFLDNGRHVLFSGTPCQIAGLRNFLGKTYEHLITVDVICHGAGSREVWRKYLHEIEESIPTCGVSMGKGLRKLASLGLTLTKENARQALSIASGKYGSDYLNAYSRNLILCPVCLRCPVKDFRSQSDLTLSDYRGAISSREFGGTGKGLSMILVHTDQGAEYLKKIPSSEIRMIQDSRTDLKNHNVSAFISTKAHPKSESLFKELSHHKDVSALIRNCLSYPRKEMLLHPKALARSILKRIKRIIDYHRSLRLAGEFSQKKSISHILHRDKTYGDDRLRLVLYLENSQTETEGTGTS